MPQQQPDTESWNSSLARDDFDHAEPSEPLDFTGIRLHHAPRSVGQRGGDHRRLSQAHLTNECLGEHQFARETRIDPDIKFMTDGIGRCAESK